MNNTSATPPLLELRGVKTWFPILRGVFSRASGQVRAVDGVSFALAPGATLGLVGESGCGKSVLARTIMGLDRPTAGEILFQGENLPALSGKALRAARRSIQIVFQDPFSSLNPRMTVMDLVTEGMIAHGMIRPAGKLDAAISLLKDVGMDADALPRYPHEFSGGQRQRISIARAVSLKPRLVICDEPTSALDVSVQAQAINLLMGLREKYGLAYIFISHNLGVVRHVADDLAVMYLGRIIEKGPADMVLERPRHPYTMALISAVPEIGKSAGRRIVLRGEPPTPSNPPSGCRFRTRCPLAIQACGEIEPRIEAPADEPGGARAVACIRKDIIVHGSQFTVHSCRKEENNQEA